MRHAFSHVYGVFRSFPSIGGDSVEHGWRMIHLDSRPTDDRRMVYASAMAGRATPAQFWQGSVSSCFGSSMHKMHTADPAGEAGWVSSCCGSNVQKVHITFPAGDRDIGARRRNRTCIIHYGYPLRRRDRYAGKLVTACAGRCRR